MNIEMECEEDGRWIAEVPDLPGVMVYGQSREEAISKVKALALRVLADKLEHGDGQIAQSAESLQVSERDAAEAPGFLRPRLAAGFGRSRRRSAEVRGSKTAATLMA